MYRVSRMNSAVRVIPADLSFDPHRRAVADLVNMYAQEPLARGRALPPEVLKRLPDALREFPTTRIFLAQNEPSAAGDSGQPSLDSFLGIAVCFVSFSTFAAAPAMNVHDIAVRPQHRGRGVGTALLQAVEREARRIGCCKMTLEVHRENSGAIGVYRACGFADGTSRPAPGDVWFFEKLL